MKLVISQSGPLKGTVRPPSDKSLTHRGIIFAMLAKSGSSTIRNPLVGEDCLATLEIAKALGCTIERDDDKILITPPESFVQPKQDLDCGNSGTTMRLMIGVLAAMDGINTTLVGDTSLSRRPMARVTKPLMMMGADIDGENAPLKITGKKLHGISYDSPVASAQIKSSILLAGLNSTGETWLTEPSKSRDHTERFLEMLDVELLRKDELTVGVNGNQSWTGFDFSVPGDISSAAFLICAASMIPGSEITLKEVGVNETRSGVLDAVQSAGVKVKRTEINSGKGEPIADLVILGTDNLKPLSVSGDLVPRLIDEIPVLAVLATQCDGVSKFRDAKELRIKETDRIEVVAEGLRKMGARVTTYEDGLDVEGPVQLQGAEIDATGDHRIGMAFAIAGLIATGETTILNSDSIQTSYPEFEQHLNKLRSN